MKKLLLATLLVTLFLPLQAQVRWLGREYDFGSFREETGPQKGEVMLINEGAEPTLISRVKSTCGCTVAGYTDSLIEPGDTAKVWFTYNPAGRPGRFEKHIKVYTGPNEDLTSIKIYGTVIGSSESLKAKYPRQFGPMLLSDTDLAFGKTIYGRARHEYISGYNQGSDTLQITWSPAPKSLSLGLSSRKVAPGDLFTLGVYLNTRDEAAPGPIDYTLRIYPNSADTTLYAPLHISADVIPDTSALTEEQLRQAPFCMVYPSPINLGNVKEKPVKISFRIQNDGKSPLQIHRIGIPGSQALRVKQFPSRLDPGKSSEVKAEILPAQIPSGPFSLDIAVSSNDPLHPTRLLRVTGTRP